MATSSSPSVNEKRPENKRNERQNQVMVGELPSDFLRVTPMTTDQQLANDMQTALALQQQMNTHGLINDGVTGRLTITVVEAKLTKNYGMTRMDPYVRLRLGNTIYETHTDTNGAKTPCWNKVFHCFMFPRVSSVYIEIFDECAFTLDEKIAWAHFEFPETVMRGEMYDDWIPLNGRQGDGKEGLLHIVISYLPIPTGTVMYPHPSVAVVQNPLYVAYQPTAYPPCQNISTGVNPPTVTVQPPPPPAPAPVSQPVEVTDADVEQVKEMFPDVELEVIRSVMESENGNKDRTVTALLQMSETS